MRKHNRSLRGTFNTSPSLEGGTTFSALADTPLEEDAIELIAQAIAGGNALACKWAPREKSAKGAIAKKLWLRLKMSPKECQSISQSTLVLLKRRCVSETGIALSSESFHPGR